jgi:hypothetical protein
MRIEGVTYGSDPELFVFSEEQDKIVSSIGLIGGSKETPLPIKDAPGFYVQEDNVLAEFNIPPVLSKVGFVDNIHKGIEHVKNVLPKKYTVRIQSSHNFEPEQLNNEKDMEMGCDPDWNAWSDTINTPPPIELVPTLRSSGGHLHIGYKNADKALNILLVKMLEVFLGVPSTILDRDMKRRILYGRAGSFRHKDSPFMWGVEYRTLSSFWLRSKTLTGWVYDNAKLAIEAINNDRLHYLKEEDFIVSTINNGDAEAAQLFVEQHNIPLPQVELM